MKPFTGHQQASFPLLCAYFQENRKQVLIFELFTIPSKLVERGHCHHISLSFIESHAEKYRYTADMIYCYLSFPPFQFDKLILKSSKRTELSLQFSNRTQCFQVSLMDYNSSKIICSAWKKNKPNQNNKNYNY